MNRELVWIILKDKLQAYPKTRLELHPKAMEINIFEYTKHEKAILKQLNILQTGFFVAET